MYIYVCMYVCMYVCINIYITYIYMYNIYYIYLYMFYIYIYIYIYIFLYKNCYQHQLLKVCVCYVFASFFLSLNESTCQTGKYVFYCTLKALSALDKIKF